MIHISLVSSRSDQGLGSEARWNGRVDRATFLNKCINAHQGACIDAVALHLRCLRKPGENPAKSELLAARRNVSDRCSNLPMMHDGHLEWNHIPVEYWYLIAVAMRTRVSCVSLFAPLTLTKSSVFSKKGNGKALPEIWWRNTEPRPSKMAIWELTWRPGQGPPRVDWHPKSLF